MTQVVYFRGGGVISVECAERITAFLDGATYYRFLDEDGNIVESIPLQEIENIECVD